MNYFAHPYVSNSDLTKLQNELNAVDQRDLTEAFRFGTLVHAIILEPHKVDLFRRCIQADDGRFYEYSQEEIDTARKMKISFLNDSFCRMMLETCEKEKEMYHEGTRFSHNGMDFTLDTRRKYDLWNLLTMWGGDVKSTTATTQAQFEASISRFDYDRARVFYAAGSGALQDVIIGISKVAPYRVFKVFMKLDGEGLAGELWQEGERKCSELAFKYWMLKDQTVSV